MAAAGGKPQLCEREDYALGTLYTIDACDAVEVALVHLGRIVEILVPFALDPNIRGRVVDRQRHRFQESVIEPNLDEYQGDADRNASGGDHELHAIVKQDFPCQ